MAVAVSSIPLRILHLYSRVRRTGRYVVSKFLDIFCRGFCCSVKRVLKTTSGYIVFGGI